MYGRINFKILSDGYLLELTPTQFELVRRVLVNLYGGSHSAIEIDAVAGEASTNILQLRDREVDFRSHEKIDVMLSASDLRALCASLAFAYFNRTSEEAFHNRYGFYSENVQAVGRAVYDALQRGSETVG